MQKICTYSIMLLLFIVSSLSFAQDKEELTKVTDQLYFISGLGGNVSFLVTDDGVLVVDSGTLPEYAKKIEAYISSVTTKPIKYLILTHYHLDHSVGVCGFDKGITIIGHENITNNLKILAQKSLENNLNISLPEEIKSAKNEMDSLKKINIDKWNKSQENYNNLVQELEAAKKIKIVTPDLTFSEKMNIYLGKDTVTLKFPGNTHTSCNIIVEFKNQNAAATGDLFFNHIMPFIDYNAKCNTKNWIEQLKLLSAEKYKNIIPGHGKLASSEDLLSGAEYLTDLRAAVQSFISKNKTLDETLKELKMEKYSDFGFHQALPIEIEAVYKEIKGM